MALIPSVYCTCRFCVGGISCAPVTHCRFQGLPCCQTSWVKGIVLDVDLPSHTDLTVESVGRFGEWS